MIGKKQIRAAVAILDSKSVPNHKTKSGAIAITGVVLSAIAYG